MADALAISLRALSFIAALQAAGAPLFLWLFADRIGEARRPIAVLARRSAVAGLLLAVGHQLVEPARVVGALAGIGDGAMQALLLASDAGTATIVRVFGLALIAFASLSRRFGAAAAVAGGTLIVTSFTFMGHTAASDLRWLLIVLLILHLLIVALWFGSLLPLYLAGKYEDIRTNGALVRRFSALAIRLVPVIFLAGLGIAVVLVPGLASLGTPYGTLLLSKIGGFALLMGLAALNKWRLGPAIEGGDSGALRALQRSVLAEWVLIAAVLAATATMTALFAPTAH
ncbi:MAG TPA: CopD family protein [Hyphomicrobiaceae bacterium]